MKHRIAHVAANSLLAGLKSFSCQENYFDNLPNDCRALLKTKRKLTLTDMRGGKYYHFGIENYLKQRFQKTDHIKSIEEFQLLINIDGMPLTNKSSSVFWPILGLLKGETSPFLIGVFHGLKKTDCVNQYLTPFVEEMKHLKKPVEYRSFKKMELFTAIL